MLRWRHHDETKPLEVTATRLKDLEDALGKNEKGDKEGCTRAKKKMHDLTDNDHKIML